MGDINVDLLKTTENNASGDFSNMFSSYFFTPFVLLPTRLRSKTLIDDIFSNDPHFLMISPVISLSLFLIISLNSYFF